MPQDLPGLQKEAHLVTWLWKEVKRRQDLLIESLNATVSRWPEDAPQSPGNAGSGGPIRRSVSYSVFEGPSPSQEDSNPLAPSSYNAPRPTPSSDYEQDGAQESASSSPDEAPGARLTPFVRDAKEKPELSSIYKERVAELHSAPDASSTSFEAKLQALLSPEAANSFPADDAAPLSPPGADRRQQSADPTQRSVRALPKLEGVIAEFLSMKGFAHRNDILAYARDAGCFPHASNPLGVLEATLSRSPLFNSIGRGFWGLNEIAQSDSSPTDDWRDL